MNGCTKETILFVDDEESILDIASTFFEGRGYNVLTACNGREAADLIDREKIDCCFTDINMPEMDGLELAEHIRKRDNTLPVIIMTGFPSLDNTIQTLKNGVVDFLIKPVNLNQMELCVQRVLRERQLFVNNILLTKEVEGKAKLQELNRELLYKVDELNTLNRIMTDFAALRESSDVFKQLVDLTVDIARADRACFYVINDRTRKPYEIAAANGRPPETAPATSDGVASPSDDPCLATALDPMIETLILDVSRDEKPLLIAENTCTEALPADVLSLMLVPLRIREKTFGILSAAVRQGPVRFAEKDIYYLAFMSNKAADAIENLALYENIYDNLFATLYAFVKAIEARDPYTEQHSNRVTRLSIALARELGRSAEEQEILNVAGRLHDIGKIGIRDDILLKPGRLTEDEYRIIKQHPVIGADIVDHLGLWTREKQIIRAHHERFDGKGYPDGLGKDRIPYLARILSVADVYDAIASDRAYRKRMEEAKILDIMYGGAGTQFDPDVIDAFRKLYTTGKVLQMGQES